MNNYRHVSQETALSNKAGILVRTTSQIPYDNYYCECRPLIDQYFKDIADGKKPYQVTCPASKKGYKKYDIVCNNCGHVVATCYATDKSLTKYCDLHYVCENDGEFWYGALALNISPVDGKLGIECSCGQDTRDFRANNTLPLKDKELKIVENTKGREFGKSDSKFSLK